MSTELDELNQRLRELEELVMKLRRIQDEVRYKILVMKELQK